MCSFINSCAVFAFMCVQPLTFHKMCFSLHVSLRSGASDLSAVLHPETIWGH